MIKGGMNNGQHKHQRFNSAAFNKASCFMQLVRSYFMYFSVLKHTYSTSYGAKDYHDEFHDFSYRSFISSD
jgi:hypothetical protein